MPLTCSVLRSEAGTKERRRHVLDSHNYLVSVGCCILVLDLIVANEPGDDLTPNK